MKWFDMSSILSVWGLIIFLIVGCVEKPQPSLNADSYFNRGVAYYDKGQLDLAISDYSKAIEINPRYAKAYYSRGVSYYADKGQLDRAISDSSKAIEINPRLAEVYHNRSLAYTMKDEHNKAWNDVKKAQALGHQIDPHFLKTLGEASGVER